ncbi:MAG: rhamnogalacturonan acetylesterase [Verrucomicrobiota bacterium]
MPLSAPRPIPIPRTLSLFGLLLLGTLHAATTPLKFHFSTDRAPTAPADSIAISAETIYSSARGYGIEPVAPFAPGKPFYFTARVPQEGNYRVTVTLGDPTAVSLTTIKAELRRLVVAAAIATAAGETKRVSFIVNTRTPRIAAIQARASAPALAAGSVKLKAPRETVQEAWAWDDAITLEFGNTRPAVRAIEIEPVTVPTLFLLGDSTVCDQSKEPYNSWGQMLPRFFKPTLAVANHGESGETYRDSLARRRLDKIVSALRPGDWVMMQFGHNDQKQIAAKTGGPGTTYKEEIRKHVAAIRAHGGTPILVSPMERRRFTPEGKVELTLTDYANAARDTARELEIEFIDLHALSQRLYAALGPERSARAFATAADGQIDNTHHNNYGSYEVARCIVQALRDRQHPLAQFIADDVGPFDPSRPDNPDTFAVPASSLVTNERPLGDDANAKK